MPHVPSGLDAPWHVRGLSFFFFFDRMAEVQARRSKKGAALDDRSSRGELLGRKRRTEEMPTEAQPPKRARTVTSPTDVGRRGTEPQADGEGTSSH